MAVSCPGQVQLASSPTGTRSLEKSWANEAATETARSKMSPKNPCQAWGSVETFSATTAMRSLDGS